MFVCCVFCFVKVFESRRTSLLAESMSKCLTIQNYLCITSDNPRQTSVEEEPSSVVVSVLAYADEG